MTNVSLPEPAQFAPQMITEDAYTTAQLRAYGDARVRAAIEGLSLSAAEVIRCQKAATIRAAGETDSHLFRMYFTDAIIAALKEQAK